MVNPLNIILPLLFAKPKPAATPPEKHPFQAAEEFASVLRTVADATDNDLGQRPLSGGGSVKNGLIYREAAVKELTKMAVTASSRQTRVFARCTNAIELLPEAEDAAIIKHAESRSQRSHLDMNVRFAETRISRNSARHAARRWTRRADVQ